MALLVGYMNYNTEGFIQTSPGSPLNAPPMGPYDTASGGWMSSEHMPVGDTPQNQALEENKLMLLEGNEVSASCCPASFSTDTGCVCLTDSDKRLFASRGGNK